MRIENLTNPGQEPVEGDLICIYYDNGNIEQKYYTAPPEVSPNE